MSHKFGKGDEIVLDAAQWRIEAQGQINDIKNGAIDASIAENLGNDNQGVYMNITTLENLKFCIHLSALGFRVVGGNHDSLADDTEFAGRYFETPYAMMSVISPGYDQSVAALVIDSLVSFAGGQRNTML